MIKRANRLRRGLVGVLAGVFVAGAAALVAVPAAPAQAAMPNSWGFGYLDNPAPALPYNLLAAREASSVAVVPQLTAHPGLGLYQVTFYGIGTPAAALGVVHVTAAPPRGVSAWCQARSWGPVGPNEVINVGCYRAPGAGLVNTDFSVAFSWSSQPAPINQRYGYLESNGGTGTITQFDSAGGAPITSTLVSPGLWHVVMNGVGGPGPQTGGIQVTPVGVRPEHCKVRNWGTAGAVTNILVMCFTPAGTPANVPWTLTYQNQSNITGLVPPDYGYIWHTVPPPPATTNFNSACGAVNTVTPGAPYVVRFPCVFAPPTNVLLSASGANQDFCSLTGPPAWGHLGPAVIVPLVQCFHVNGAPSPADDFFATYTSG